MLHLIDINVITTRRLKENNRRNLISSSIYVNNTLNSYINIHKFRKLPIIFIKHKLLNKMNDFLKLLRTIPLFNYCLDENEIFPFVNKLILT